MSDDWKPGDLAMIVIEGEIRCPHGWRLTGKDAPPSGAIRRVIGLRQTQNINSALAPIGATCGCIDLAFGDGFASEHRCVKIRPHTPDEQDAETIRLLNGAPVKEPIHA